MANRQNKDVWSGFDQLVYDSIIPSLLATEDIPKSIEKDDLKQSLFLLYWTEKNRFEGDRDSTAKWLRGVLRNIIISLQNEHRPVKSEVIRHSDYHDVANFAPTAQELDVFVLKIGNSYKFVTSVTDDQDSIEIDESYQKWFVAVSRRLIYEIFTLSSSRPRLTKEQCDSYLDYLLNKITKTELSRVLRKTHILPNGISMFIKRLNKHFASILFKRGMVTEEKLLALGISGWKERLGIVRDDGFQEFAEE